MAILHVNIPDDLKARFEQAFAGQDLDAVLSRLMYEALERTRAGQRARRSRAIAELLALRDQTPPASAEEIRQARELGRP